MKQLDHPVLGRVQDVTAADRRIFFAHRKVMRRVTIFKTASGRYFVAEPQVRRFLGLRQRISLKGWDPPLTAGEDYVEAEPAISSALGTLAKSGGLSVTRDLDRKTVFLLFEDFFTGRSAPEKQREIFGSISELLGEEDIVSSLYPQEEVSFTTELSSTADPEEAKPAKEAEKDPVRFLARSFPGLTVPLLVHDSKEWMSLVDFTRLAGLNVRYRLEKIGGLVFLPWKTVTKPFLDALRPLKGAKKVVARQVCMVSQEIAAAYGNAYLDTPNSLLAWALNETTQPEILPFEAVSVEASEPALPVEPVEGSAERFVAECCVELASSEEKASVLYQAYSSWAGCDKTVTQNIFSKELRKKYRRRKRSHANVYVGIQLCPEFRWPIVKKLNWIAMEGEDRPIAITEDGQRWMRAADWCHIVGTSRFIRKICGKLNLPMPQRLGFTFSFEKRLRRRVNKFNIAHLWVSQATTRAYREVDEEWNGKLDFWIGGKAAAPIADAPVPAAPPMSDATIDLIRQVFDNTVALREEVAVLRETVSRLTGVATPYSVTFRDIATRMGIVAIPDNKFQVFAVDLSLLVSSEGLRGVPPWSLVTDQGVCFSEEGAERLVGGIKTHYAEWYGKAVQLQKLHESL